MLRSYESLKPRFADVSDLDKALIETGSKYFLFEIVELHQSSGIRYPYKKEKR